jgi:hypothetical protein
LKIIFLPWKNKGKRIADSVYFSSLTFICFFFSFLLNYESGKDGRKEGGEGGREGVMNPLKVSWDELIDN